uniref:Uncharacterized protein n=1 Tax=Fagus sylvatica TaxID=28930 RepID=A0A2N9HPF4_FAGSY
MVSVLLLRPTNKNGPPLCIHSYIAIDVQPIDEGSLHDKSVSFLTVEPRRLNHMVEQNFEALSQFGGVKALTMVLGTNIKGATSGNVVDLIHRKNVFGVNKSQKAPAKAFPTMSLKHSRTPLLLYFWSVLSAFGIKQHGWKDEYYHNHGENNSGRYTCGCCTTLAYSMNCMMADHALASDLSANETLGSDTTICTDKTGPSH